MVKELGGQQVHGNLVLDSDLQVTPGYIVRLCTPPLKKRAKGKKRMWPHCRRYYRKSRKEQLWSRSPWMSISDEHRDTDQRLSNKTAVE